MQKFPERDWKVVRKLHPIVLQRYCQQVFQDVQSLTPEGEASDYHAAYLELYQLVRNRDKEIGYFFDDLRRSRATLMVMGWKNRGLITDDEFAMFSEETQAAASIRL